MKHNLIVFIFLIQTFLSYSQFDLTSSYNIKMGEYTIYGLDPEGIDEGGSGSGQTWDFSSQSTFGSMIETYVDPATTPYAAQFPGATLAATGDEDTYGYYITNDSKFSYLGSIYSSGEWTDIIKCKNEEVFYSYPFNYGTTQWSSSIQESTESNSSGVTRIERTYNYDTVTIDGSGTLIIPGGGSYTAIRLKGYGTQIDSAFTPDLKFIEKEIKRYTTFRYYVKGESYPVLIIWNDIYGQDAGETNAVLYKPSSTTSVTSALVEDDFLSVYPNPAQTFIQLKTKNDSLVQTFVIYNQLGEEVLKNSHVSLDESIDISSLTNGFYIVKLIGANSSKSQIFIKGN